MLVLITGDRSLNPGIALPIVQQVMLQQLLTNTSLNVVVGLDRGVEAATRAVLNAAGVTPLVDLQFASKDWDEYVNQVLAAGVEKVYFLHGDPASSNLFPAFSAQLEDNQLELVNPALLFANA